MTQPGQLDKLVHTLTCIVRRRCCPLDPDEEELWLYFPWSASSWSFVPLFSFLKGRAISSFKLCWSRSTSLSYAHNAELILQWMWFLWARWSNSVNGKRQDDKISRDGGSLPDLAFLMLDPKAEKRISTRQLVAMIATPRLYYFGSLNKFACEKYRLEDAYEDPHIPLPSKFKATDDLTYAESPKDALRNLPAQNWESAKRAWLAKHMWWEAI